MIPSTVLSSKLLLPAEAAQARAPRVRPRLTESLAAPARDGPSLHGSQFSATRVTAYATRPTSPCSRRMASGVITIRSVGRTRLTEALRVRATRVHGPAQAEPLSPHQSWLASRRS